jgi:oligopeptide transport system ATP-binding protein
MQIVFQDPSTSLNERMSVEDIVSEGALNFKKELMDKNNPLPFAQQVKESVSKILSEVGLPETVLKRYQHELSGGQKQRISIARSMLIKPKFLIADEPISSLDVTIRAQILNLLNVFLKANNLTIMFIAHDLSVVRYFCDRIVVIYKGNVVEVASSLELFKNPVHPYTKKLLMSAPIKEVDVKEFSPEETEYNNDDEKYVFFPRTMVEVSPNHFVFANKEEVKK